MILRCFLLVVIGAMIGWITNFIAIKMLFRPYKEINFIFFKIQGLLPKRKNEIGHSIAEVVDKELVSMKDIISKISSSDVEESMGSLIDGILDSKLKEEILKNFPMAAFFLSDSVLEKIKGIIKSSIIENKDEIMEFFCQYMQKNVDIQKIIVEKVDAFSLEKVEEIIVNLAKKEFKHIEYIGAVLGGIIGLVQFAIVSFI